MTIFLWAARIRACEVWKYLPLLMACVLVASCQAPSEEALKKERALYNALVDQLAWQCYEICNGPFELSASIPPKLRGDSIKDIMRAQAERRVLYYQPKIGAARDTAYLGGWISVEASSWHRFYSTFKGKTAKDMAESVAVSSELNAEDLHVDYIDVVKLDTASHAQRDSSMAVVGFSKPFYTEEGNRAVVYVELGCGSKSIRGDLFMVRYLENRWVIDERRRVWTSN